MTKDRKYFQAVAIMTGYTIGVGMLSLPYLFQKSGILTFFIFFILLVPAQYIIHLIYTNIILVTSNYHFLPGYAEIYLGKKSKGIVFFVKIFGSLGALLAYIITTGIFLNELLYPFFGGNEMIYSSFIFFLEVIIIYFGVGMFARAELVMTFFMILIIGLMSFQCSPVIKLNNFSFFNLKYFLLPFGAVLFSLDGSGTIPIIVKFLKKDKLKIKSVIRVSMFLSVLVTAIFTLVVLGVTGDFTTEDSLKGLNNVIGGSIVSLALIFGIFSLVTSFLGVAEELKETFCLDFKINKTLSLFFTLFFPYTLYLLGMRNLVEVIIFVGAFSGGILGIFLILIFKKIKNKKNNLVLIDNYHDFVNNMLIILFSLGIFYEIIYFVFIK